MNAKDFTKNVITNSLKDIKVELDEEFDRNFQRKAFFTKAWKKKKYDDGKGSLLVRSGVLRRSLCSDLTGTQLNYSSSEVYAAIQNEGGTIVITEKMKKFFWAKFYEATNGFGYTRAGTKRNNKKNRALTAEAEFFKAMALKKVGSKVIIPARQFVGESEEVNTIIKDIVQENIQEYLNTLIDNIRT
ncbi:phage virion morphogenesis protein [Bacteroides nordii]|jgi:phage gpG-like protein|uniref:phage virion morphogenesis protein n=1 Tax=Bacteroides nordii TaxID=291645 RepID=UPI0018A8E810|nr:phage virion morphogenesis protein [Bacteroides nordii]